MRIKETVRKFCTLNPRHADGFTLVELIIVIAILAILAGVSLPVYNNYIKKANEAADKQLLAAINTAFASACMESKVDVENVTAASISVQGQKVYGVSSVTATETDTSAAADLNVICPAFTKYYAGNEDAVFKAENVNSLVWNDAANSFECSEAYTDLRLTLSNGKTVVIPAEDIEDISKSTFADMGYSGIAETLERISNTSNALATLLGAVNQMDRLTAVMVANGLLSTAEAEQLANDLALKNMFTNPNAYKTATKQASNGLQMVTAKYLANGGNVNELLGVTFTDLTALGNSLKSGASGTVTVSAFALQYSLMESFANNPASSDTKITVGSKEYTVKEYLTTTRATSDPAKALATIQATEGYKAYAASPQYTNDVNGIVGTLSVLGNNLGSVNADGTVKTEGVISPGDYYNNGIGDSTAKDLLTQLVGP